MVQFACRKCYLHANSALWVGTSKSVVYGWIFLSLLCSFRTFSSTLRARQDSLQLCMVVGQASSMDGRNFIFLTVTMQSLHCQLNSIPRLCKKFLKSVDIRLLIARVVCVYNTQCNYGQDCNQIVELTVVKPDKIITQPCSRPALKNQLLHGDGYSHFQNYIAIGNGLCI